MFRQEMRFHDRLLSLAGLPGNDLLPRILELSARYQLPEIWRRAGPSAFENEFLIHIAALISSPEAEWISLIRDFLARHGWRTDLRGRSRAHPAELIDTRRGRLIDQFIPRLEKGFALKLYEKRKRGYRCNDEKIESKLLKLGYDASDAKAILEGRTVETAACHLYRQTREPEALRKNIQISYKAYKRMVMATVRQVS